jgi:hypothetical protein
MCMRILVLDKSKTKTFLITFFWYILWCFHNLMNWETILRYALDE